MLWLAAKAVLRRQRQRSSGRFSTTTLAASASCGVATLRSTAMTAHAASGLLQAQTCVPRVPQAGLGLQSAARVWHRVLRQPKAMPRLKAPACSLRAPLGVSKIPTKRLRANRALPVDRAPRRARCMCLRVRHVTRARGQLRVLRAAQSAVAHGHRASARALC